MEGQTICWTDIPVTDLDRAIKFYSAVLDAPVSKECGGGHEFGLLPHEDNNVSGCLTTAAKISLPSTVRSFTSPSMAVWMRPLPP